MRGKKTKRPGYLTQYAAHAGITKTAAADQLKRVGIDYMQPFAFEEADRKRKAARHADRMPFTKTIYEQPANPTNTDQTEEDKFVFAEHQAKREYYKAEISRLEYEERVQKLIEAEKVDAEWFRLTRIVRDAVMNIPSRLAGVLASESDERTVNQILEKELRDALEALASIERNETQAA